MTSTATPRPVAVRVFSSSRFTVATLSKSTPWHARVMWQNSLRSIGLYFEQYGGECATRISTPSPADRACRSSLNRYLRPLLLPPPSQSRQIERAPRYSPRPNSVHHHAMLSQANSLVSLLVPTLM